MIPADMHPGPPRQREPLHTDCKRCVDREHAQATYCALQAAVAEVNRLSALLTDQGWQVDLVFTTGNALRLVKAERYRQERLV